MRTLLVIIVMVAVLMIAYGIGWFVDKRTGIALGNHVARICLGFLLSFLLSAFAVICYGISIVLFPT